MPSFSIPEPVRLKAIAAGVAGEAWLAGLDRAVAELATAWGLTLGPTLAGGTEALVLEATMADGRAAVLKLLPSGAAAGAGELETLFSARGRGYAAVYAVDAGRGAVLLERLGPPLATLGLAVDLQIAHLCTTLAEAWAVPLPEAGLMNGLEKAHRLRTFIATTWRALGQPCPADVIDTALRYADVRARSFDPRRAVLAHGDAHPWNALLIPQSHPQRFKLIDPDGLIIERAYDLGILMREWTDALLAGDPLQLGRQRCRHLAELTGMEAEPIWQWGFIERVSTGLLFLQVGLPGGHEMLTVAQRWAEDETVS
jgi:streptomycin 6-kinase